MRHLVALSLAVLAVPAVAEPAPPVRHVSYADLDLSGAVGRATLERRVDRAVGQVCNLRDAQTLRELSDAARCVRTARADARRQMTVAIASAGGANDIVLASR